MVGVDQVSSVAGAVSVAPASGRVARPQTQAPSARDGVAISSGGRQAAIAIRLFQESEGEAAICAERVTHIREALERGAHKVQQVVMQVAATVTKYLDA